MSRCLLFLVGIAIISTLVDSLFVDDWLENADRSVSGRYRRFHSALQTEAADLLQSAVAFKAKESMPQKVLHEYVQLGRAPDISHDVVIAVRQRNTIRLRELLHDVSDPLSDNYGNHLTNKQVKDLTANLESTEHIENYLKQRGVSILSTSPHGDFITARATITRWEKLLNCQFYEYQVINGSKKHLRTPQYQLESTIFDHVLTIFQTVQLPPPRSTPRPAHPIPAVQLATTTIPGYVTPATLMSLYNINITTPGASLASQGVYESIGQTFSPADLTLFQRKFNLPVEQVAHVIGGHSSDLTCHRNGGNDCVEANLDVQYLMAVAPHIPTTYYYWDGEDFMVDWLVEVSAMTHPPLVLSISYGMDEGYLTPAYAEAFDTLAMKLGLQGVTITASSGDDGAAGNSARSNSLMCGYRPSFPASSPYVTAVGATMGPESGKAETVCQGDKGGIITTGGGFSDLYEMPSWQKNQTKKYFETIADTANEPHVGFNRQGRGYPDISALGYNYVIALASNFTAVSGTSASSPVVAGMISLINAARLAHHKSAVGWINPALYYYSSRFVRDVTSGHNKCTAEAMVCCAHGFAATTGWDAATGLGVIDFPAFKAAMMEPGSTGTSPSTAPSTAPHGPTMSPSSTPPSQLPTMAPTLSRGWLSLKTYDAENCGGKATTISAMPTNYCAQLYAMDFTSQGSMAYSCHGDGKCFAQVFLILFLHKMLGILY